jgi:crotonobetainyl-CoA:carnitine CoA-transferase CaiB-like acyl-CoA transferase
LISVTGTPERGPTPVGAAIVDQHGGALLAMGILGALVRRLRDGVGTRVEASLLNSGLDLQGEALVNFFAGGMTREVLQRESNLATWFHAAPYGVYPAHDGHIVISLCDATVLANALDSDALREVAGNDRYKERDEYARRLRVATAGFSREQLGQLLDASSIWWAPINFYDELLSDPQIQHAQVFREITVRGRTVHLINHPNRYDGEVPELRVLALEIGEHTREIMGELGYRDEDVERLVASRAVAASRLPTALPETAFRTVGDNSRA